MTARPAPTGDGAAPVGGTDAERERSTHHGEPVAGAVHRPTVLTGFVACALALAVSLALVDQPDGHTAIGTVALGLAALAAGVTLARRRRWIVGAPVLVAGAVVIYGGFDTLVALPELSASLTLFPAAAGLVVLTLAVLPLRGSGSRWLAATGVGLLALATVIAGVLGHAGFDVLVPATVAVVCCWDAAENAIAVGRQLGRRAGTARIELVHLAGSAFVGLIAIAVTHALAGMDDLGTVGSLALVLVAVVVLIAALEA